MHSGYIKLWRKLEHSPIFTNSEAVHLFIYLLIKANRIEREKLHGTVKVNLLPGQLITGRKKLSEATGISESKVYRLLDLLKSEQQIEQQTNSKFSIITIVNWSQYQESEQQIEQQVNNKRTTNEQQVNTDNKEEKLKKEEKEPKTLPAPDGAEQEFYETKKKRKLTGERLLTFLQFWDAFGDKSGKADAADAWYDLKLTRENLPLILSGAERYAKVIRPDLKRKGLASKMAQGWLSGRRWEDEHEEVTPQPQQEKVRYL